MLVNNEKFTSLCSLICGMLSRMQSYQLSGDSSLTAISVLVQFDSVCLFIYLFYKCGTKILKY